MSALGLINPLRGPCPPDGYRWKCPLCGWESHAWDYRTWVEQAEKHINGNPTSHSMPTDLGAEMEEQLCSVLPPGWCNYADPNRLRPSVSLDWSDVLRGTEALACWTASGFQEVNQAEAERRAIICSRCHLNVRMTGCSACQAVVQKLAANYHTKHDPFLDSCAACKCGLKLKVHLPQEILDKENSPVHDLFPDFCWNKKGGVNYVPSGAPLSH